MEQQAEARNRPVKTCSCGREYTAKGWALLHLNGIDESGEWRTCPCGSTLLVLGVQP